MARNRASRILTGFGLLILTGGMYTVTVGTAMTAQAPRIEAPYVASADRPPGDVTPVLVPPAPLEKSLPVAIAECSSTQPPNTCAHGKNAMPRSLSLMPAADSIALTLLARLKCDSFTPFGLPVVPEV